MIKQCKTFEGAYKRAEVHIKQLSKYKWFFEVISFPQCLRLMIPHKEGKCFDMYPLLNPMPDIIWIDEKGTNLDFYYGNQS